MARHARILSFTHTLCAVGKLCCLCDVASSALLIHSLLTEPLADILGTAALIHYSQKELQKNEGMDGRAGFGYSNST